MLKRKVVPLVALLAGFQLVQASQLEDGLAAIESEDFDAAVEFLLPLASDGNAAAQYAVGGLYYNGWAVDQDLATAFEWFRRSAEQGHTEAKASLAFMHHYGRGVAADYDKAIGWYRQAAAEGDTDALIALAVMFDRGQGAQQSAEEAFALMQQAAELGDPVAQHNLGVAYSTGYWMPQDHAAAVNWFRTSAEQGEVEGQFQLGWMYEHGKGVTQDKTEAVKWYRTARKSDLSHAPSRDALMALDRQFAKRYKGAFDGKHAKRCRASFEKALARASKGNARWQFCVGLKYADGPKAKPVSEPHIHWITDFPIKAFAAADYYLGATDSADVGATVNKNLAVYWLEKAAEQGYRDAQTTVALNYFYGMGIPDDRSRAKHWLRKAIEQGDPTAMEFWGWLQLGEFDPDRLAGSLEGKTYTAPNNLFRAQYLLSGGLTSVDSFDTATGRGTVSLSNDFGALNGVIYGPADASELKDWFDSFPLDLIKSKMPKARVLREERRQFHGMDAWIAVVEIPGGGLMVKYDVEKGTSEPSDSVRGFAVFRKHDHFFALMCEVNIMGFYRGGRTYDPENWDAFLTDLGNFYSSMKFRDSSQ